MNYDQVLTSEGLKDENASLFALPLHIAQDRQAIKNIISRRRLTTSINMLALSEPSSYSVHAAPIAHTQFSPDGNYLATCRYVLLVLLGRHWH